MTMKIMRSRSQRPQKGFGIIEIMIALVLGIIIMLGVTQIATNNSNTSYELDRTGRQMENAAYALGELEYDLTNAAFWGEKGAESPGIFPPVCPSDITELKQAMGYPVAGGTVPAAPGNNFDCVPAAFEAKEGTNYLAVRRASSCATDDPGCAPAGTNYHIKVHACFNETSTDKPGDFDIFSSSEPSAVVYTMRDCDTESPEYRLLNRVYYINENDQLMRAELVGTAYEETTLVDGVEWMRFEYGMDRDGDGQVDEDVNGTTLDPTYDLATATAGAFPDDWADVVMVRISLVVRNTEPSSGFVDNNVYTIAGETYCADDPNDDSDADVYDGPCDLMDIPADSENNRRQVYSRTVSLRNVAGRRQVE